MAGIRQSGGVSTRRIDWTGSAAATTSIDDERNLPRTVYPLAKQERFDLWEIVHDNQSWIPWIDALYGTATFLPMADGATYEVEISQSGLLARPLNQAARTAVGAWH